MKNSILFVCLGNICRSSLAEGILRDLGRRAGSEGSIEIDSAGTGDWHVGNSPDPRAVDIARQHGVNISAQRARQFKAGDLDRFDLVLAMDRDNLKTISAYSGGRRAVPRLFLDYAGMGEQRDVPDPYFGGDEGFHEVYELIATGCERILERMRNDSQEQ